MGWAEDLPEQDLAKMAPDAKHVRITAPSIVAAGEDFDLHLAAFRGDGYPDLDYQDTLSPAETPEAMMGVPAAVSFSRDDEGVLRVAGVRLERPGVYRVRMNVPRLGMEIVSNPIWCMAEPKERLYWGDIHVHSNLGNCHAHATKSPTFLYTFARNVAALDFASATDHVEHFDDTKWQASWDATARFNEPGRFTAFHAYEYTFLKTVGHANVYFRSQPPRELKDIYLGRKMGTLPEIWADLDAKLPGGRDDYMTVIHHPAWDGNSQLHGQSETMDDYHMPAVEIYSKWGCSEYRGHPNGIWSGVADASVYVQDALAAGYRLGFIASSDDHNSAPGSEMGHTFPYSRNRCFYNHGGKTGIWSAANTRESLFDALRQRRCFASSFQRVILNFSVDSQPMGSIANAQGDGPRHIEARIFGTDPVQQIELIRNNRVIDAVTMKQDFKNDDLLFEYRFDDSTPLDEVCLTPDTGQPFAFYYLRLRQGDGTMAWASPVWLLG